MDEDSLVAVPLELEEGCTWNSFRPDVDLDDGEELPEGGWLLEEWEK